MPQVEQIKSERNSAIQEALHRRELTHEAPAPSQQNYPPSFSPSLHFPFPSPFPRQSPLPPHKGLLTSWPLPSYVASTPRVSKQVFQGKVQKSEERSEKTSEECKQGCSFPVREKAASQTTRQPFSQFCKSSETKSVSKSKSPSRPAKTDHRAEYLGKGLKASLEFNRSTEVSPRSEQVRSEPRYGQPLSFEELKQFNSNNVKDIFSRVKLDLPAEQTYYKPSAYQSQEVHMKKPVREPLRLEYSPSQHRSGYPPRIQTALPFDYAPPWAKEYPARLPFPKRDSATDKYNYTSHNFLEREKLEARNSFLKPGRQPLKLSYFGLDRREFGKSRSPLSGYPAYPPRNGFLHFHSKGRI